MEVTRIFDIPELQLKTYNKKDAFLNKRNGKWDAISSADLVQQSNNFSFGLLELGVQKDEKVASISTTNRYEWNICDYGMLQVGAVHVPVYPTISEEDYVYIFNDAKITFCFVSDKELYDKVMRIKDQVPSLKDVYTFDEVEGAKNYKEVLTFGESNPDSERLNSVKASINPMDLATLIYTSGTTGKPKGVMLSHNNLVSNVKEGVKLIPCNSKQKGLSFLPMCHVFERTVVYTYQYIGLSIYYAESMETIGDNIKEVHPHIFTAVPRLIEKVFDKVVAKGNESGGLKAKIFNWAVALANDYELENRGFGYNLKYGIAKKLVYSKIKGNLDPNLVCIVSGSAALQPRLARFFWAADMPILEGYGLTETSPIISVNNYDPKLTKFGSVGPVINDVEVKIAEDGEILVKGPNVMMGYYNRPDATAEAIDSDGWFHTGDIGVFEGKFLKITDRKKEIFKTSGGKYVAPQPIENKLKESSFIEQIMICGEGEKHASALIVPAFEFLQTWTKKNGINYSSNEELIKNEKLLTVIKKDVDRLNENFGKTEQIKKFVLLPNEWSIDNGELTPTLKVKRKVITAKYKDLIDGIYK